MSEYFFNPESLANNEKLNFPLEMVAEIHGKLAMHGIHAWLDGGWAVDAMVGEQTRPHQDLDLLVPIEHGPTVQAMLEDEGYQIDEQETEKPHRIVLINRIAGLMIDFHMVTIQEDGSAVFKITNYKENVPSYDHVYAAEGLEGRGVIAGVELPCITLEEQVRCRTKRNYSFDDPDRQREGGINADLHDLSVIEKLVNDKLQ